ncbi:hypothetical protein XFF6992_80110 [Xanthomonas citri pv. fuscans]|nr:hypothetical protein XFF6992_80110 [Xanthomonas citri pv. fuscans]SOO35544.1 hypothetical protein XFF6994_5420009 [Xanthomonas citri pv. fuscans]
MSGGSSRDTRQSGARQAALHQNWDEVLIFCSLTGSQFLFKWYGSAELCHERHRSAELRHQDRCRRHRGGVSKGITRCIQIAPARAACAWPYVG